MIKKLVIRPLVSYGLHKYYRFTVKDLNEVLVNEIGT